MNGEVAAAEKSLQPENPLSDQHLKSYECMQCGVLSAGNWFCTL